MVMIIGGHIKAKGPLPKNKHTRCLPQEDQVGGFPTNTLIGGHPRRGYPGGGPPDGGGPPGGGYPFGGPQMKDDLLGPLEDRDPQVLKDQQDL